MRKRLTDGVNTSHVPASTPQRTELVGHQSVLPFRTRLRSRFRLIHSLPRGTNPESARARRARRRAQSIERERAMHIGRFFIAALCAAIISATVLWAAADPNNYRVTILVS